jgi:hypothetical protein
MICDRCYQPLDHGDHGVYLCPLEARRSAPVVWTDDIPGGLAIAHGLCNEDGTPRTYYSKTEIRDAARAKGLISWCEKYTEDRTKDARVHDDWLKSGEAQRARRDRVEARQEKALAKQRQAAAQR